MVDSRQVHPETVIDLSTRRERRWVAQATQDPPAAEQAATGDLLALPFLMDRIQDGNHQVQMWSAYQLVERWETDSERYLERLWSAALPEIRDSAIHLIAKHRCHSYAFPLLRVFNADEGGLRVTAGQALGHLRYAAATKSLEEWFRGVYSSQEANLEELEASAKSLLLLDNRRYWNEIHALLKDCHNNHSIFSVLFGALAANVENEEQALRIARAYKAPREIFHDFHITQKLVEMTGRSSVSRYLQSRMNARYSLAAAYQEALQILGVDIAEGPARALLEELSACSQSKEGLARSIQVGEQLIDLLAPEDPQARIIKAFLQGCACWVDDWEEAVLKVREVEYHLLVSLPLVALLNQAERKCLADPAREAMRIIRIYQSSLLSPAFMARVLNLLASREGEPVVAGMRGGPLSGWLRDEEKDALWKLMTQQLEEVDYPFEQILPEPWMYGNPVVMERLAEMLKKRLPQYLVAGRGQAVDYCLEVFMRSGGGEVRDLLLEHFDVLLNHHYRTFIEVMTHLPDARFLKPLMRHYREGELEMNRLIRFICAVHRRPCPKVLQQPAEKQPQGKPAPDIRLRCLACGLSYQYLPEALYVDEERIEQRQVPTPQEMWVPQPFSCKNCGADVPLEPEQHFLNDLYAELLAARMLRLSGEEEAALEHVHLIPFPVLNGKTCHPDNFLKEVRELLRGCQTASEEMPLLIELGRFYLEIGDLAQAKESFQRIQSGPVSCPLALYYLGIIAFQDKNPYDARVCFSRFVDSCNREEFEGELDNPVDMAQHYLKLLDKREFKRSHFRLISS
ncbi:MAG: hypothetical protein O7G32_02870 [SAR324 cluster bacterium]|nr:hypothetical protein [SAR324 cluster bacterium]